MSNPQNMLTKSQNGRIDIHHHILPEKYVAKLKEISITTAIGREYLDGSIAKPGLWMMGHVVDPVRLMNDMERMGIKIQMEVTEGNRNTKGGINNEY